MTNRLRVDEVKVSYGTREVLRGVSFTAQAGEFVALLGNNGAGKSTLLDVIAGVRLADAGHVMFADEGQERAKLVSHLPQAVDAGLPFVAEQIVAMGRYPHMDRVFESDADRAAVEAAMRRTGCWDYRRRRFGSLSGGERQRVLLAACVAQKSTVMLLDEPSTFLDIAAQLECFGLLKAQAADGKLCIAVTHDLNLALTFCTRLLVLENGVIARDLATSELGEDDGWLRAFSPALRLGRTDAGTPWVWYA